VLDYIHRASATGLYEIRGLGAKRRLPHFDDLVFLAASLSRYPLEGYRERCLTKTVLGTRFAKKPVELDIPITIAGMSFGSLSANVKQAIGLAASEMGTSTTTGDGGMTSEERHASKILVYQCLPSRYGFRPDDVRRADAIEVVHRPGRQARRRRHAAGPEGQPARGRHAHAARRRGPAQRLPPPGLDRP
jgi:glutamate synthase domain-containing protein 2